MTLLLILSIVLGITNGAVQHSGYINVNSKQDSNIFYWLVESQNDPENDPVVLWVSGGPGCSGGLALLYENGPWTVADNLTLVPNPFSWNKVATVIWIDQPADTGYSYAKSPYVVDEPGVAEEMRIFFQTFFKTYPQYKSQPFYISGESYGGRYVPTMAEMILEQNAKPTDPSAWQKINLKGISIGNGVVDPIYQYPIQGQFAFESGLVNTSAMSVIGPLQDKCADAITQKKWDDAANLCGQIVVEILNYAGDINPMNYKLHCKIADCFVYTTLTEYLNDPNTKKQLGVPDNVSWQTCNFEVAFTNFDQWSSFSNKVAKVLEANVDVLGYYGDLDCVCPWNGGLNWMQRMKWSGQSAFQATPLKSWSYQGTEAGQLKSYKNLKFLKVSGAGHMTPHDLPEVSLEMFTEFLAGIL